MEKVIQEHLNENIHQISLIVDNIIMKFCYEESHIRKYVFYYPNELSDCFYRIDVDEGSRSEFITFIDSNGLRMKVSEFRQIRQKHRINILAKYEQFLYDNEGSLICRSVSIGGTSRNIYYFSNKINYIKINYITNGVRGSFIVVYDLAKYLTSCEEINFERYTREEFECILNGDFNLAHDKGIIAYNGEDGKVVIAGCESCFHGLCLRCLRKKIDYYLENHKDELIIELERLRKNPKRYNSQLLSNLTR